MTLPPWLNLWKPSSKRRSGCLYELSDILRESLESPVPDDPHVGWRPYSENHRSMPAARLSRHQDTVHADLEEYHADDELSELPSSPYSFERSINSFASGFEERSGLVGIPAVKSTQLSSLPYHYYIDPDHDAGPARSQTSDATKKCMPKEWESQSPPTLEPVARADEWTQEIVHSQCLGLQPEYTVQHDRKSNVYQALHDATKTPTDAVHVVRTWQAHSAVESLDTPQLPPPSFAEHFRPRHGFNEGGHDDNVSNCAVEAEEQNENDSRSETQPMTSCPTTHTDFFEHHQVNQLDRTTNLELAFSQTHGSGIINQDASKATNTTQDPVSLLHSDPARALADLSDYQAIFRRIRGDTAVRPELTAHRLQRSTTMFNTRKATIGELRSFWEVQR